MRTCSPFFGDDSTTSNPVFFSGVLNLMFPTGSSWSLQHDRRALPSLPSASPWLTASLIKARQPTYRMHLGSAETRSIGARVLGHDPKNKNKNEMQKLMFFFFFGVLLTTKPSPSPSHTVPIYFFFVIFFWGLFLWLIGRSPTVRRLSDKDNCPLTRVVP